MGSRAKPNIYSIAAHRGFADALVAGLVPRYSDGALGLAKLTLLLPSSRAARTVSEAFIRHSAENGLLMPRMATVGDLDLDESLGPLLDPLGADQVPPAVEPTRRWLEIAQLIEMDRTQRGQKPLPSAARLRLARDMARSMDRLLVEERTPEDLIDDPILDILGDLSHHWIESLRDFASVQQRWLSRLKERGEVDTATRRNLLFERARDKWRAEPPELPIIAAGVTSASPALARLLRAIADLPNGAVILPDLDLSIDSTAWEELGRAGLAAESDGAGFSRMDVQTHPQYHLKLLLNRMGVSREEVRAWHRKGATAGEPARSLAIGSLFLPPEASQTWISLDAKKRRLAGVRLMTSANSEGEAQAIALLVREALEEPEKRVAVVTADRTLARRVVQHLTRWNIIADDSAGRPLSLTPAGRLIGLLAELMANGLNPATLVGTLAHPLVHSQSGDMRRAWLASLRLFERALRGPSLAQGLEPLRMVAKKAGVDEWWTTVESHLSPLLEDTDEFDLADALDVLASAAEDLTTEAVWSREDGRALANMVENLRAHARAVETLLARRDVAAVLRDAMEEVSVRPPYGGHPRVAIYGLLESRMARADLIVCGGLNEASWPQSPQPDPLLAPGVLRALGIPGAEFRIGLAAHDLAGALGAPEVVLSRALRDKDGPTIPSRFVLRVEALLGELVEGHREQTIAAILPLIDRAPPPAPSYTRPEPRPTLEQRQVTISATALDRLLGDPYQFYAREILGLKPLDPLAADPFNDPALRGILVHEILDRWHRARLNNSKPALVPFAQTILREKQVHPLFWGLWRPRIVAALERFERWIAEDAAAGREVIATEIKGAMTFGGVRVFGIADRIDRMPDGTLAIVDYKTGGPPSASQVEAGYALQLGLLGLIARDGRFEGKNAAISGQVDKFEYWSLARAKGDGKFGYRDAPIKGGTKTRGLSLEEFLPAHEDRLAEAIENYIKGTAPFRAKENPDYPGYTDYDQLMRLDEWITLSRAGSATVGAE